MNILFIILGLIAIIVINLFSLIYGIKLGQKITNNEPIELPKIENSVKVTKKRKEIKADEEAMKIMERNLENIENYDGTSNGQIDI